MPFLLRHVAANLFLCSLLVGSSLDAGQAESLAGCVSRDGLPHVLAKLVRGGEVRVAYLGGSITAQAGGWRTKSLTWLQAQYPAARCREIDATVPGTGSDLGVFRYRRDVLAHQPDLVFVEFAVNDARTDPAVIERSIEGIVRQTWRTYPATDICFVYTISKPLLADLEAGRTPSSVTAMERVANHYGIPSIDFGPEVARRVATKTVLFQVGTETVAGAKGNSLVFSTDGTHPLPAGHEIYAQVFVQGWRQIARDETGHARAGLISPLHPDNYEAARLVPIRPELLQGKWEPVSLTANPVGQRFAARLDTLWRALEPGARLTFTCTGTFAGIYDLMGPDCGAVELRINREPPQTKLRVDGYCTQHRLAFFRPANGGSATQGRIALTLSAQIPAKKNILFAENRGDLEAHPEKYAGNFWYVGALMILGDTVEQVAD